MKIKENKQKGKGDEQHEETGIKSVFTIIFTMYWIKYLWQYAIHRRADMNSMVMSMIRMESGWEKDHRMSHSLIQAY